MPEPSYIIPLYELIALIRSRGYNISISTILDIEKVLASLNLLVLTGSCNENLVITTAKLPGLLSSIVATDKKSQEEIESIVVGYINERRSIKTEGNDDVETEVDTLVFSKRKRNGSYVVLAALILFTLLIVYLGMRAFSHSNPDRINIITSDKVFSVGDTGRFSVSFTKKMAFNDSVEWIFDGHRLSTKDSIQSHFFDRDRNAYPLIVRLKKENGDMVLSDTAIFDVVCSKIKIDAKYSLLDSIKPYPVIGGVGIFSIHFSNNFLPVDSLQYKWYINDSLVSQSDSSKYRFINEGKYLVKSIVYTGGRCIKDSLSDSFIVTVGKMYLNTTVIGSGVIAQLPDQNEDWKSILTIAGLVACACFVGIYFIYFKRWWNVPRLRQFDDHKNSPYHVQFDQKNDMIDAWAEFRTTANLLRGNQETSSLKLDIGKTIKKTSENAGFPTLMTKPIMKEIEYLILLDRTFSNSHLSELFDFLVSRLEKEYVRVEKYVFWSTIDVLEDDEGNSVALRSLVKNKSDYALIVLGDSRRLKREQDFLIHDDILQVLNLWKRKAIITSVSLSEWGPAEWQLYQAGCMLIPAELEAIELMAKGLTSGSHVDRRQIYECIIDLYSSSDYKFDDLEELREYLDNETLFQWVCSIAVYPLVQWPLTIALGKAVTGAMNLTRQNSEVNVAYNTLLKIARIDFVNKTRLSDGLRLQMLKALTRVNHLIARKEILSMLEEVRYKVGFMSLAKIEWDLQYTVNAFFLYANYPGEYEHLREEHNRVSLLWPRITDWPLMRLIKEKKSNLLIKNSFRRQNLDFKAYFIYFRKKIILKAALRSIAITVLCMGLLIPLLILARNGLRNLEPEKYQVQLAIKNDSCYERKKDTIELIYRSIDRTFSDTIRVMKDSVFNLALTQEQLQGTLTVSVGVLQQDIPVAFRHAINELPLFFCPDNTKILDKLIYDSVKNRINTIVEAKPSSQSTVPQKSEVMIKEAEVKLVLNSISSDSIKNSLANYFIARVDSLYKGVVVSPGFKDNTFDSVYLNDKGQVIYYTEHNGPKKYYLSRTTKTTEQIYNEPVEKGTSVPISNNEIKIAKGILLRDGRLAPDMHMHTFVEIPSLNIRLKMMGVASADNGKGGIETANNREYGGIITRDNVVGSITTGAVSGQFGNDSSRTGLFLPSYGIGEFHTHPSGYVPVGNSGNRFWGQPPSPEDINAVGDRLGFLFGMRAKIVYVYDKTGVIATIPFSEWVK